MPMVSTIGEKRHSTISVTAMNLFRDQSSFTIDRAIHLLGIPISDSDTLHSL